MSIYIAGHMINDVARYNLMIYLSKVACDTVYIVD